MTHCFKRERSSFGCAVDVLMLKLGYYNTITGEGFTEDNREREKITQERSHALFSPQ